LPSGSVRRLRLVGELMVGHGLSVVACRAR
jgi:hypothetical protein